MSDQDLQGYPTVGIRRRLLVRRARDPPKNADDQIYCDHPDCKDGPPTFQRSFEWNRHMDKHERPYKCFQPGCERVPGYTYPGALMRHERIRHPKNTETRNHQCPYSDCDRSRVGNGFTYLGNLRDHLRRRHMHTQATTDSDDGRPSTMLDIPRGRASSETFQVPANLKGTKRKYGSLSGDVTEEGEDGIYNEPTRRSYSFSASPYSGNTSPVPVVSSAWATHPTKRAVSPASSIGSHASGVSHPPGSKKGRRGSEFANMSSESLIDSVANWDDGYSSPAEQNATSFQKMSEIISRGRLSTNGRATSPPQNAHLNTSWSPKSRHSEAPMSQTQLFICDCCPKKPKKFDNADDLSAHEKEKQYSCQYCNHRFRNPDEAQRHTNSMHLRRQSWSCSTISSFQATFQDSASFAELGTYSLHDICGYCGQQFPNFPRPDWDARFEHLTTDHHFGECNNAKKFFRADHFRQHLKHAHNGISGRWTNALESVAMKTEVPPPPFVADEIYEIRELSEEPLDFTMEAIT